MSDFRSILNARGYEVGARLGGGGEAVVYCVEDHNGHSFAVKVHQKPIDDNGALLRRFAKELQFSARLQRSQYLVRLQESFDEGGYLFTVWELADGTIRSLQQDRKSDGDGSFDRAECQQLLLNVAKGLDAIHARSGVHGDIKPENLLVFNDEHLQLDDPIVKIGDFGTARIIESETTRYTDMRTPQYSLPGRHFGPGTRERDLFGLAVVYAELRLGRHPYGSTSEEVLANLQSNRPQLDGLDDDELAAIKPLLVEVTTPDSAVEWLTRLASVQTHAGLSPYKIIRSHFLDQVIRLEKELKRRFRDDSSRTGKLPPLSRLIREERMFRGKRRMSERGLSLRKLFDAIDVRNDLAHEDRASHGRKLKGIEEAARIIHDAADLLEGKEKREWKPPKLPPEHGARMLGDGDDMIVTSSINAEQAELSSAHEGEYPATKAASQTSVNAAFRGRAGSPEDPALESPEVTPPLDDVNAQLTAAAMTSVDCEAAPDLPASDRPVHDESETSVRPEAVKTSPAKGNTQQSVNSPRSGNSNAKTALVLQRSQGYLRRRLLLQSVC